MLAEIGLEPSEGTEAEEHLELGQADHKIVDCVEEEDRLEGKDIAEADIGLEEHHCTVEADRLDLVAEHRVAVEELQLHLHSEPTTEALMEAVEKQEWLELLLPRNRSFTIALVFKYFT